MITKKLLGIGSLATTAVGGTAAAVAVPVSMQSKIKDKDTEKDVLKQQVADLTKRLNAAEKELKDKAHHLRGVLADKAQLEQSKKDLEALKADLTTQLNNKQTELANLQNKDNADVATINAKEAIIAELSRQLSTKQTELEGVNSQLSTTSQELARAKQDLEITKSQLTAEKAALERQLATLRTQKAASDVANQNKITDLELQLQSTNTRLGITESMLAEANKQLANIKQELEASRQSATNNGVMAQLKQQELEALKASIKHGVLVGTNSQSESTHHDIIVETASENTLTQQNVVVIQHVPTPDHETTAEDLKEMLIAAQPHTTGNSNEPMRHPQSHDLTGMPERSEEQKKTDELYEQRFTQSMAANNALNNSPEYREWFESNHFATPVNGEVVEGNTAHQDGATSNGFTGTGQLFVPNAQATPQPTRTVEIISPVITPEKEKQGTPSIINHAIDMESGKTSEGINLNNGVSVHNTETQIHSSEQTDVLFDGQNHFAYTPNVEFRQEGTFSSNEMEFNPEITLLDTNPESHVMPSMHYGEMIQGEMTGSFGEHFAPNPTPDHMATAEEMRAELSGNAVQLGSSNTVTDHYSFLHPQSNNQAMPMAIPQIDRQAMPALEPKVEGNEKPDVQIINVPTPDEQANPVLVPYQDAYFRPTPQIGGDYRIIAVPQPLVMRTPQPMHYEQQPLVTPSFREPVAWSLDVRDYQALMMIREARQHSIQNSIATAERDGIAAANANKQVEDERERQAIQKELDILHERQAQELAQRENEFMESSLKEENIMPEMTYTPTMAAESIYGVTRHIDFNGIETGFAGTGRVETILNVNPEFESNEVFYGESRKIDFDEVETRFEGTGMLEIEVPQQELQAPAPLIQAPAPLLQAPAPLLHSNPVLAPFTEYELTTDETNEMKSTVAMDMFYELKARFNDLKQEFTDKDKSFISTLKEGFKELETTFFDHINKNENDEAIKLKANFEALIEEARQYRNSHN